VLLEEVVYSQGYGYEKGGHYPSAVVAQKRDIGEQKKGRATPPMSKNQREFERAKRSHPGPLPPEFESLGAWLKAGKPRWRTLL
jgi:hypothetical protein